MATAEHTNDSNPILSSHGTSCASQIGGKNFGLAFEANMWTIRIALGGSGGVISGATAIDISRIFHQAKKINDPINHDPTVVNNSFGAIGAAGNNSGTQYNYGYRGNTDFYIGSGTNYVMPVVDSKGILNFTIATFNNPNYGFIAQLSRTGSGRFLINSSSAVTTSAAAEDAIAAGVIMVAASGNDNQKKADKSDLILIIGILLIQQ